MKETTFTIFITFLLSLILCNCQQEKLTDFQEQQTILRGKILNYKDSVIIFTHPGDPATNYLKGEKYAVNLNADGSFEWRITLNKPLEVNFSYGSYLNDIYLEPGYSSFIEFNANNSNRKITFTGDGSLENNCNQDIRNLSLEKSTAVSATSNKLSFQQIKQLKEEEAKQRLIVLKERNKNKHLSDHFFRWKQAEITYEALADLYFPTKEFKLSYSKAAKLSINQLDDDFAALYSHNYNSVVGFYSVEEFVRLLKANKKPGHNYDHANKIFKGQTKEASLAKTVLLLINYKFDSLAKLYHEKAQTDIKNPNMLAHVNVAFGQYEQAKRKPYQITKETIASNYPLISQIMDTYKGKLVYIDFWASWCGPCIKKMDYSIALQDRYTSKEIIFLYLGYNDKEVDWRKIITEKNIGGAHLLLTQQQTRQVELLFKINGIPHYAIIDKEGNIVDDNAPDPEDPRLTKLFDKYL